MRVEGLCSSYEMPSYWPWRQVLTNLLGETDLLDQSRFASQPELFAAIAETIEAPTRAHRVLVIFEDAHWADPGSLALLEFLIGVASGQRLMLLVTALDQAVPLAMSAGVRRLRCCLPHNHHRPQGDGQEGRKMGVRFSWWGRNRGYFQVKGTNARHRPVESCHV